MLVPGNRRTLSVLTTLELLQIIFRLLRRTDPTLPKVAEIVNLTMSRDFQDSSGLKVGLERVRNGPSVGGSFAARWARMVLKRCSSERGEREKRFYGGGKGERRRTAF